MDSQIDTASTTAMTPRLTPVGMWYHSATIILTPT